MAQLLTRTSVSDATTVRVPPPQPPPPPYVMKDYSISSATFKPPWSTAVADASYAQLGALGVSAAPLNLVEKPQQSSRRTITEDYKAWEANKTSGNLDKTEVKETSSSPGVSPPASTVYSVNPGSLNVPSVRNADDMEYTEASVKFDASEDPVDGIAMPSHLKSFPGIAMFFEMVDSSNTRKGIVVSGLWVSTLRLTPNPETLTINSTKKIGRYATMSGWVEEHWGDDIDTINFTGSTFSFYDDNQDVPLGLTNEFRDKTKSYLYLKELVTYFQVNGCIYQGNEYDLSIPAVNDFLNDNPEFITNHPRKGMIKERLYIKMNYDYLTLYGRFDSFDIIEDSSAPFKFKYSAVFKAEKTVYNLYERGWSF